MSTLNAALEYAARGWPVFPCRPGAKTPITPNGLKDATISPEIIKGWWQITPSANIAIRTGKDSGLVVLDFDVKNGQPGRETFQQLQRDHGTLITRSAKSPTGGFHLYFQHPGGKIGNRAGLLPGLDIRGDGGYILAPPSVIDDVKYEWAIDDDAAPLPAGLLKLLNGKTKGNGQTKPLDRGSILDGVPEGQRDDALFRYACSLQSRGTSQQEAAVLVREVAENCSPPFDQETAREKVERAYEQYADQGTDMPEWEEPVPLDVYELPQLPERVSSGSWPGATARGSRTSTSS